MDHHNRISPARDDSPNICPALLILIKPDVENRCNITISLQNTFLIFVPQKSTTINKTNGGDLIPAKFIGKPINLSRGVDVSQLRFLFWCIARQFLREGGHLYWYDHTWWTLTLICQELTRFNCNKRGPSPRIVLLRCREWSLLFFSVQLNNSALTKWIIEFCYILSGSGCVLCFLHYIFYAAIAFSCYHPTKKYCCACEYVLLPVLLQQEWKPLFIYWSVIFYYHVYVK